jgi:FKBP-type peptidyl-prolyl cis-trans isomerase FkpA
VFVNPVRMHPIRTLLALALVAISIACNDPVTSPSGFAAYSQTDLLVGTGTAAETGSLLSVRYTGWIFDRNASDSKGLQFDASAEDPFTFTLGAGQVILGWDQGLVGMRVGGRRRLVIPPSLAYGASRNRSIPPNATLVFDVELVEVQ